MSISKDSPALSWEEEKNLRRTQLKARVWKEIKTGLNIILLVLVVVLGISVLIMKFSHEPGIHLQLFNESGVVLKDVSLQFSWSEYIMPELPATPRTQRQKYYGAIIQKVVNQQNHTLTITWIDAKGIKHQQVERDMYLPGGADLIVITFNADGTVTVNYKGLYFFF
jgi:hypothetical protein